jgi:hypothetical protein
MYSLFLLTSHGQFLSDEVRHIVCPEFIHNATQFFIDKYDCRSRNNSFNYAYRFFRGVYARDMEDCMDGLSADLRKGFHTQRSCRQFLGLGLYNATIITMPHWLFVYETQEGQKDFLMALQSLFENCQRSEYFGPLMKEHVILLQSPTARDSLPEKSSNPASSWRGIHNHRMEVFVHAMKKQLGPYVDGVIPALELTYARRWTVPTLDGVHLRQSSYRELFHVQIAAIQSAFKFKRRSVHDERNNGLPLMSVDDPNARWFAGLDLE